MFAQNILQDIKVPLFLVQSLYDDFSIGYILGIDCIKDRSLAACNGEMMEVIEEYRTNVKNTVIKAG